MTPSNEDPRKSYPTQTQAQDLEILAMDWGARRIGLAIKHAASSMVLPKRVLTIRSQQEAIAQLRALMREEKIQAMVVGLPINPDPAQAAQIKKFCRKAREGMTGVRWFFVDETLTTQAADDLASDNPSRLPTDDLAACMILERFLSQCPRD